MRVRHAIGRSKENPKLALLSGSQAKPLLNTDPRRFTWEEDKVYEPDWEISAADLEEYVDISRRD
jgi:hypothetical protein